VDTGSAVVRELCLTWADVSLWGSELLICARWLSLSVIAGWCHLYRICTVGSQVRLATESMAEAPVFERNRRKGGKLLSIVISSASVLVALVSAFFSYRSSRIARRGLVASSLIASIGDMVAALHALESAAIRLESKGGVRRSREVLREYFDAFKTANSKVDLLVVSVGGPEGVWVRSVVHNMAADLLQADEFSELHLGIADSEFGSETTEEEKQILRRSSSYQSVVGHDITFGSLEGALSLKDWWAERVLSSEGELSVYSTDSSYIIQHARILSDFMSEHLEPWARELVRKRLK